MPVAADQRHSRSGSGSALPLSANTFAARDWIWVLGLTLFGAWLRLWQLGARSLWLDEGASFAMAHLPWDRFASVWWRQEANMTAYYLLLRPWLHLGSSEAWLRLPSALFGIASIPVLYLLAHRLMSRRAALFSAALLAVSPAHVYYSQEARSYSLTVFLVLLSSFYFVRALTDDRSGDWAWWIVFSVLSVYGHYFAALVLVSQAASMFLLPADRVRWKRVIAGAVAIAAFSAPGIAFVLFRGPTLEFPWMPQVSGTALIHLFMFLGGSGSKIAVAAVLWAAGLVVAVRTCKIQGRSEATWRDGLVVAWALLPILITVLISLHRSVFNQKYLLVCLPAMVLLAALGADGLETARIGPLLLAALCVMSTVAVVTSRNKPTEDWRGASNAILASAQPGDAVVFFPFYSQNMFDYYSQRSRQSRAAVHVFAPPFYAGGEDERDLLRAVDSDPEQFRHVWVVVYAPGTEPDDLDRRSSQLATRLQKTFGQPMVRQFTDIAVLKFGK